MRRLAPASNAPCNTSAKNVNIRSCFGTTPTSPATDATSASFTTKITPQDDVVGQVLDNITLQDLLKEGVLEYVDVNEENNCLIALSESALSTGMMTSVCVFSRDQHQINNVYCIHVLCSEYTHGN